MTLDMVTIPAALARALDEVARAAVTANDAPTIDAQIAAEAELRRSLRRYDDVRAAIERGAL